MWQVASYACSVAALGTGVMFFIAGARRGCVPDVNEIRQTIVGLLVFHLCAGGGLLLGLVPALGSKPNWWPVVANAAVIGAFWITVWAWPC